MFISVKNDLIKVRDSSLLMLYQSVFLLLSISDTKDYMVPEEVEWPDYIYIYIYIYICIYIYMCVCVWLMLEYQVPISNTSCKSNGYLDRIIGFAKNMERIREHLIFSTLTPHSKVSCRFQDPQTIKNKLPHASTRKKERKKERKEERKITGLCI